MRSPEELIQEVAGGIDAVDAAKRELKQRTVDMVAQMKADHHTRTWGCVHMRLVCAAVDPETAKWAMHYFNEAWPEEVGDERPAPDAPAGA